MVCFPRVSGGVSSTDASEKALITFSPRQRGCFPYREAMGTGTYVFPASAGVFPLQRGNGYRYIRFPRTSGGVSDEGTLADAKARFSPHQRGCFLLSVITFLWIEVFPAPAGVFQKRQDFSCKEEGFPRTSGGVSAVGNLLLVFPLFSPHQRGCFYFFPISTSLAFVFPAPAGVFLRVRAEQQKNHCFPRTSGGVSVLAYGFFRSVPFSQHQRGCFQGAKQFGTPLRVFPAPAGVFLKGSERATARSSFPRISGGVSTIDSNTWGQ